MRHRSILAGIMLLTLASFAHAQECLHGPSETAGNAERRQAALKVAQAINAAQAAASAASPTAADKRAGDLDLSGIPDNFAFTLFINGRTTYAFSLKDFADPCY